MLCEAVLVATFLDESVKRNEHCYNGGQKNLGLCEKPFQAIVT